MESQREGRRAEREEEEVFHSYLKDFRTSTVAFSATMIAVSGGIVYWLTILLIQAKTNNSSINPDRFLLIVTILILGASFISALSVQYYHFLGYKHFADSERIKRHEGTSEKAKTSFKASNNYFSKLESTTKTSFFTLVIGIVNTGIIYLQVFI